MDQLGPWLSFLPFPGNIVLKKPTALNGLTIIFHGVRVRVRIRAAMIVKAFS